MKFRLIRLQENNTFIFTINYIKIDWVNDLFRSNPDIVIVRNNFFVQSL